MHISSEIINKNQEPRKTGLLEVIVKKTIAFLILFPRLEKECLYGEDIYYIFIARRGGYFFRYRKATKTRCD